MENSSQRFRLRIGDEIVGFKRSLPGGCFYSKDEYAWSGNEIEFELKDAWTGIKDSHQKHIYANDILLLKVDAVERHLLVVFDEALHSFSLIDYTDDSLIHADATVYLFNKHFRRLAFNFKQLLP